MRLRLLALLPTAVLLVLVLPVPAARSSAVPPTATLVDEVAGMPEAAGISADAAPDEQPGVLADDRASDADDRSTDLQVSGPVRTPIEFSMLAFTAPRGATISYRTSTDGTTWTPWTHAEEPDGDGPDVGSAEGLAAAPDHRRSGEPVWVGEAAWVQARVTGTALDDVDVDLIDSMGLSRGLLQRAGDAVRAAWHGSRPAAAQASGPAGIVTRRQWGANESLRKGKPSYAGRARYAVLHHSAGTNNYSAAEAPGVVRGIYAYHTKSRGWSDIGYNFLVDRFGTVYEGRYGGIDRAVIGAHALGFNTESIGVSMMGEHGTAAVSAKTREAIADLLAWKFAVHGIDPSAKVSVVSACGGSSCKHPKGTTVTLPTLFAHRDVGSTSCPGAKGYSVLPGLRKAIGNEQVDVLVNHSVAPDHVTLTPDGLEQPVKFAVDLLPAAAWEFVVKYNDGTVMYEQSGTGRSAEVTWSGTSGMPAGTYWYKFTSGSRKPAIGTFIVQMAAFTPPFSDDDTSVHAEAIVDLYDRGITKGCTTTTFCPVGKVTRGQMASFLVRTMDHLGIDYTAPAHDWFTDDGRSTHHSAINTLAENRIADGCERDRFCPNQAVLRGDVALWMAEAFDLDAGSTDHFTDDDGTPYEWAINALADAGLTLGCGEDRYCDREPTSRGQMASFLSRAIHTVQANGLLD